MGEPIPMLRFFLLLGLIAVVELLLMVTVEPLMHAGGYPLWIRAVVDAGLLAVICFPVMLNFQLRPMQLAYYDSLTGLPNRQLFHDRLEHALVVARREMRNCGVIFLDLDRFKPVNDCCGHRVGDMVLKQVAVRLEGCMRESDTVARVGGDEFAILLPNSSGAVDAERVVLKIADALSSPFEVHGRQLKVGVSAGIAFYPADGADAVSLLDAADNAMYRIKESKKSPADAAFEGGT